MVFLQMYLVVIELAQWMLRIEPLRSRIDRKGHMQKDLVKSSSHIRERVKEKVKGGSQMATFCIAFLLLLGNVVIQSWVLGRQARPETDEGVYLYQAKL